MSKTTHYELNTPIGSEVLSVMTGLNPNFTAIDGVMYDNETRSTQALNKANVNEQNIATALGRITTAEGDIDTLESGLETANTNISGLTSRMTTAESGLVSANNRIQENTGDITQLNADVSNVLKTVETLWSGNITSGGTATLNANMFGYRKIILEFGIDNTTSAIGFVEMFPAILMNHFGENRSYYYSWLDSASSNTNNSVDLKFLNETTIKIETAYGSGSWIYPPHLLNVYGIK
jgi:hypothetical protein